jgi:hypothetical protein
VTDNDVEVFVRDTFRTHEYLVGDAATRLLPGVRTRRRRRTIVRSAAIALAAVALAGGAVVAVIQRPTAGPPPEPLASPSQGTVPAGWRVHSAGGVEVAVPADWAINDYGCGMTSRPTYALGGGNELFCHTPEPPDKQIANLWGFATVSDIIGYTPAYAGLAQREVLVDGIQATRAEGQLADGRYGGFILLGTRSMAILTKTLDPAVNRQILDSVRLVDGVDSFGCATGKPAPASPPGGARPTFVLPDPTAISICYYGGKVLTASTKITGAAARQLAALLNAAPAGPNPDAPANQCTEINPLPLTADMVLHLWAGDETVDNVWVSYSGCTGRGLDNGARRAQISHTLLRTIRNHVHAGYHLRADIPE